MTSPSLTSDLILACILSYISKKFESSDILSGVNSQFALSAINSSILLDAAATASGLRSSRKEGFITERSLNPVIPAKVIRFAAFIRAGSSPGAFVIISIILLYLSLIGLALTLMNLSCVPYSALSLRRIISESLRLELKISLSSCVICLLSISNLLLALSTISGQVSLFS